MSSYSVHFALKTHVKCVCLISNFIYIPPDGTKLIINVRRAIYDSSYREFCLYFEIIFARNFTVGYLRRRNFVHKTRKLAEVFMRKVNTRYSVHLTRAMLSLLSQRDRFIRCRIAALSLSRSTYPT